MAQDNAIWKRNLAIMWVTQFFSLCGFSLALPFTPFYLRECLGVLSENQVQSYAALSAAASNLSFAVMAPIWGLLSDRFGRKTMVLRATFGGAVILFLMGFAPNVQSFLLLRFLQGLFTGTMSASVTLVVSHTPANRQGFALGVLSSSVFSGDMTGLFLGGLLATAFGYRMTFYISGAVLFVSALLVLFGAIDRFRRPVSLPTFRNEMNASRIWKKLSPLMGIMFICAFAATARLLDYSQFPLYVEMLNGGSQVKGAAQWTSWILCMGCIGAMTAGLILGKLADKNPIRVACRAAIGGAAFMFATAVIPWILQLVPRCYLHIGENSFDFALAVLVLIPLRFGFVFCSAGLEPIWNMWISQLTPEQDKGSMFGWAATFRATGAITAHLLAGMLVFIAGIRSLFFIDPLLLLCLVPMIRGMQKKLQSQTAG